MTRLAAPLFLSLCFASTAISQPPRTARDAYVDGWFKETAESDLEGALKLYRECAELAATTDRELAAKATLRMARIAHARDDREAATLLLARLNEEFAGTKAAADAATVVPADTPRGSDDVALAEARRMLDQVVSGREQVIPVTHVRTIVQTLGWAEAARAFEIDPTNFASFVRKVPQDTLDLDGWIDLALTGPSDVRNAAVAKIRMIEPERVPARLTEEFGPTDPQLANEFLHYSIGIGTDDSLAAAARVLRRVEIAKDLRPWILALLASESPAAVEVIDAWLAKAERHETAVGDLLQVQGMIDACLTSATPAAERLRSALLTQPVTVRSQFVGRLALPPYVEVPESLLARCLADDESYVRVAAILNLSRSLDPEVRRRGAAALAAEPRPVDISKLLYAISNEPAFVPDEMLDALSGPLLEFVTHAALSNSNRSAVPVLRRALEKSEPVVARALFLPRFWQSAELNRNREALSHHSPAWAADRMRRDLAAESRPGLLADIVAAAVASGDVQLQLEIVRHLGSAITDRIAAGVGDRLAQSKSPAVLLALVQSAAFHELTKGSVLALLEHSSRGVCDSAIAACEDVDMLVQLAGDADAATLEVLRRRASNLGAPALKRAILARGDGGGTAAVRAFAELVAVDDAALALGLDGSSTDSDLAIAAHTVIDELLHDGGMEPAIRVPEGQTLEQVRAKRDAALEKAKQEDNPVALVRGGGIL